MAQPSAVMYQSDSGPQTTGGTGFVLKFEHYRRPQDEENGGK
jgi:hypothetical protein